MKRLMLAAAMLAFTATGSFADGMFWVVGNHGSGKCEIVTSNPTVIGNIYFSDGPYKSNGDAKLARSTIPECPPTPEPKKEPAAGK